MSCKKVIFALLLLLFISSHTSFAQITETDRIVKSFSCVPSTTVDVYNKYGKIHVVNWDKDSVRIEIDVTYNSDNPDKIKRVKNNLDFDLMGTEHHINAKTVFGKNKSGFLSALKDFSEIFYTENSITIDYTIRMPEHVNLIVDNKYGDFYMDNHKGNLTLNISNGNIKANIISGTAFIDLKFGNGIINQLSTAQIVSSYADFKIHKADQLNIESKSSTITIEEVNVLKLESRRDKYFVNKVNNIYGHTYFTDCVFQIVNKELNVSSKYGIYNVNSIPSTFSYINLISKFSDINLFFESGSSYEVDFTTKNADISYPIDKAELDSSYNEKEKTTRYTGTIGKGDKLPRFKINAESGNIIISHK